MQVSVTNSRKLVFVVLCLNGLKVISLIGNKGNNKITELRTSYNWGVFVAIIEYKGRSATRSILGPLLFPIFINDIVDEIQCNIRLFADDTSLYIVVKDAYEAAIKINTDTEKIYEWSTRWLVNYNPKKSKAMTISKKTNKPHHPPVLYE